MSKNDELLSKSMPFAKKMINESTVQMSGGKTTISRECCVYIT